VSWIRPWWKPRCIAWRRRVGEKHPAGNR
jgi:hypothetical protein